jgi:hypothetical protein
MNRQNRQDSKESKGTTEISQDKVTLKFYSLIAPNSFPRLN